MASKAGNDWRLNLDRAKRLVGVSGFPDVDRVVAEVGVPNDMGYPISKEALIVWTQLAAHQPLFKERGIRINAVSPGPVETPILRQFFEVLGDDFINDDLRRAGRAGTAANIAPPILFLCSDAARWINGVNLPTDGGLEASVNAIRSDFDCRETDMKIDMLIGGEGVQAKGGRTFLRADPVTGDTATEAPAAGREDAYAAIEAAASASAAWAATGPGERRRLLNAAADAMEARRPDFMETVMSETGATRAWAGFNATLAAEMLREAAAMTTQIGGQVIPSNKPGTLAMTVARPKGVCLGIAPWNAPVILGTRALAMPLACGNTVVLKSSELVRAPIA